jgi:tetratricopeptide (TPR) repeat protein
LLVKDKKTLLKKYTDNLEAYELYLRGRYYVNQGSPDAFYRALEFFDQAIAVDPNYAIAHAEISFCCMNLKDFNWGALPEMIVKGITAAEKSLELDDQIAESHIAYGRILLHQRWQIDKAFETFSLANSINPNSAECHVQMGFCRTLMGDYARAKKHATRATELEPLSVLNIWYSGILLNITRSFIEAFQNGQKLVDMAPNFFAGHWLKGFANIGLKKYQEAMHCFESASKCNPGSYVLGWLGMAYGLAGEIEKAKDIIEKLEKVKVNEPECNHSIASVYASLGKWDSAIKYYNIAIDNKEGQVLWIKKQFYLWYPDFCRDPRALKLYERIGQPDSFGLPS